MGLSKVPGSAVARRGVGGATMNPAEWIEKKWCGEASLILRLGGLVRDAGDRLHHSHRRLAGEFRPAAERRRSDREQLGGIQPGFAAGRAGRLRLAREPDFAGKSCRSHSGPAVRGPGTLREGWRAGGAARAGDIAGSLPLSSARESGGRLAKRSSWQRRMRSQFRSMSLDCWISASRGVAMDA